jgi:hypothetical protein
MALRRADDLIIDVEGADSQKGQLVAKRDFIWCDTELNPW